MMMVLVMLVAFQMLRRRILIPCSTFQQEVQHLTEMYSRVVLISTLSSHIVLIVHVLDILLGVLLCFLPVDVVQAF